MSCTHQSIWSSDRISKQNASFVSKIVNVNLSLAVSTRKYLRWITIRTTSLASYSVNFFLGKLPKLNLWLHRLFSWENPWSLMSNHYSYCGWLNQLKKSGLNHESEKEGFCPWKFKSKLISEEDFKSEGTRKKRKIEKKMCLVLLLQKLEFIIQLLRYHVPRKSFRRKCGRRKEIGIIKMDTFGIDFFYWISR